MVSLGFFVMDEFAHLSWDYEADERGALARHPIAAFRGHNLNVLFIACCRCMPEIAFIGTTELINIRIPY